VTDLWQGASRWPWVVAVLWYSYRDPGTRAAESEDNFGLVRRDFRPKPSLAVFRRLMSASAAAP